MKILFVIIAAMLMVLMGRLFQLQIIKGDDFRDLVGQKAEWVEYEQPVRGTIFDSEGRVIAKDMPRYDICVVFNRLRPRQKRFSKVFEFDDELKKQFVEAIAVAVEKSVAEAEEALDNAFDAASKEHVGQTFSDPVPVFEDVPFEVVERVRIYPERFPGAEIAVRTKRWYNPDIDPSIGRLIGYLGRIKFEEFKEVQAQGWRDDTRIGRQGIERWYDKILRGQPGRKKFSRSPTGEVSVDAYEEPVPGKDIHLTINSDYQRIAQYYLSDACNKMRKRGAAVLLDPRNGNVLALATHPTYNIADLRDNARYSQLLNDPDKPFLNRAYQEQYPLGSVFKIAVSVTALETRPVWEGETFDENFALLCVNHPPDSNRPHCHGAHNYITLVKAIKVSCNSYFAQLSKVVGSDNMAIWPRKLGFGEVTGLDLPGEVPGIIGRPTARLDFYNMGIGQGKDIAVTPLQAAVMISTVANGGYIHRPHIAVDPGLSPQFTMYEEEEKGLPRNKNLHFADKTVDMIREGMWKVANESGGTGYNKARPRNVEIGAKTGTAEIGGFRDNHSWYAGFAPFDNPELVFVVIIEEGGFGADAAGGVAKDILEEIFSERDR